MSWRTVVEVELMDRGRYGAICALSKRTVSLLPQFD